MVAISRSNLFKIYIFILAISFLGIFCINHDNQWTVYKIVDYSICRLKEHGMNESEAYQYFVLQAQKIALSHGFEPVNWYESYI